MGGGKWRWRGENKKKGGGEGGIRDVELLELKRLRGRKWKKEGGKKQKGKRRRKKKKEKEKESAVPLAMRGPCMVEREMYMLHWSPHIHLSFRCM